ncbi:MAG: high light inducible protein [Synechococcaceae bacterium WB8_1B_136]|nr:high light inducible protein [Synechococcaceae bacterium WB8_1B_136]
MATAHPRDSAQPRETVEAAPEELNQWKRGFTPQAEIWNGRMAMLGLSVGLGMLLVVRLFGDISAAH